MRPYFLSLTVGVEEWIGRCEALPFLRFVPIDNRIALEATRLPGYRSRDPADRLILSTALALDATVVTKDRYMRSYRPVSTVW